MISMKHMRYLIQLKLAVDRFKCANAYIQRYCLFSLLTTYITRNHERLSFVHAFFFFFVAFVFAAVFFGE